MTQTLIVTIQQSEADAINRSNPLGIEACRIGANLDGKRFGLAIVAGQLPRIRFMESTICRLEHEVRRLEFQSSDPSQFELQRYIAEREAGLASRQDAQYKNEKQWLLMLEHHADRVIFV